MNTRLTKTIATIIAVALLSVTLAASPAVSAPWDPKLAGTLDSSPQLAERFEADSPLADTFEAPQLPEDLVVSPYTPEQLATLYAGIFASIFEPIIQVAEYNLQPRFKVEATNIVVWNETGIDWIGSDEVSALLSGSGSPGDGSWRAASTRVHQDLDSGDLRAFHELQSCMYPIASERHVDGRNRRDDGTYQGWECKDEGAAGPINVNIDLYERDGISFSTEFCGEVAPFDSCYDDYLGGNSSSWTEQELVEMLPSPGDVKDFMVPMVRCADGQVCNSGTFDFSGGYSVQFKITRVADQQVRITNANTF